MRLSRRETGRPDAGFAPVRCYGEVSEWLIEPVSKTGVPFTGTAGSNPALSVIFDREATSSRSSGTCSVFSIFDWLIALR